jgi:hypothetical protein
MAFLLLITLLNLLKPYKLAWNVLLFEMLSWSYHNPKLISFLVLEEYCGLNENQPLSQPFWPSTLSTNKLEIPTQHFKDQFIYSSHAHNCYLRKQRVSHKCLPIIISSHTHILSCLKVSTLISTHHNQLTISLQIFSKIDHHAKSTHI